MDCYKIFYEEIMLSSNKIYKTLILFLDIMFIIAIYFYNKLTTFVVTLLTHGLMLIVPDDFTFVQRYILKYICN